MDAHNYRINSGREEKRKEEKSIERKRDERIGSMTRLSPVAFNSSFNVLTSLERRKLKIKAFF